MSDEQSVTETLRGRVRELMPQARAELAEMVAFRSVFDAREQPPQQCDDMVGWLLTTFADLGFDDVAPHVTPDGSIAVIGERKGPEGAPTVLLYFHHDVQPSMSADEWTSAPWELTERDGRWYGRGAADCKGNIAVHLTALRALGDDLPVTVRIVGEGSEEQGGGGLDEFVPEHPDLLAADAILVCDSGNAEVGRPTLTTSLRGVANVVVTVETLRSAMHSGMFGGAAPDALGALIAMLATLRDADGNTTVTGVESDATWAQAPGAAAAGNVQRVDYPTENFRSDATVLDGVDVVGSGEVADMVWARHAVTVLGIDCPPVAGSSSAIPPRASARVSLRVPPGMDADAAQQALIDHLVSVTPWHAKVSFEREATGEPFQGSTDGPGFGALSDAMAAAYGSDVALQGQGGSIPLCTVFATTYPDAEIMLLGVEEPSCLIHAPNESVDPTEIENMALAEALFLRSYAAARL